MKKINKNNFFQRKCIGCGQIITNKDYEFKHQYCKRCFQYQNYNILDQNIDLKQINKVLDNIEIKNDLIIQIIDLFDINNCIIEDFKNYPNKILLVNKLSCLPNKFRSDLTLLNLREIFDDFNCKYLDIILYDSKVKKNIKLVNDAILYFLKNKNKKCYVIGKTNAGKSSLINALLKFNRANQSLLVTPHANTTRSILKIELEKYTILDTPGYSDFYSCYKYIDNQENAFLFKNGFKNVLHKIKNLKHLFLIDKLFAIGINKIYSDKAYINIYTFKDISVTKINKDRFLTFIENENTNKLKINGKINFQTQIFNCTNQKYTLFLSGIGFIVFNHIEQIKIIFPEDVKIYLTENSII